MNSRNIRETHAKHLRNVVTAMEYIKVSLDEDDFEGFLFAMKRVLEANGYKVNK